MIFLISGRLRAERHAAAPNMADPVRRSNMLFQE
jgi:hypothetical protein